MIGWKTTLIAVAGTGASLLHARTPNSTVKREFTKHMYVAGKALTLGMASNPTTGPVWNKTIEPLVVDLLENVAHGILNGLVPGLRSDDSIVGSSEPK